VRQIAEIGQGVLTSLRLKEGGFVAGGEKLGVEFKPVQKKERATVKSKGGKLCVIRGGTK